jgi:hypothetical protein
LYALFLGLSAFLNVVHCCYFLAPWRTFNVQ